MLAPYFCLDLMGRLTRHCLMSDKYACTNMTRQEHEGVSAGGRGGPPTADSYVVLPGGRVSLQQDPLAITVAQVFCVCVVRTTK
jgi:hypothetical protein